MKIALQEAEKAASLGEVPVGAVVVANHKIIAKTHNLTERLCDVTAHAEMQAITAAANYIGAKYLTDCTLYVTLEPCLMCAGALYWSHLTTVVYGATDEKRGCSKFGHFYHPKTEVIGGIMAAESSALLSHFFKPKRG